MTAGPRTPLADLLGAATAPLRKSLGIETVEDLLLHVPRRYASRGELTRLDALPLGQDVTVVAEVRSASVVRFARRKGSRTVVVITDGTGALELTFFNQPWREKQLPPGTRGLFSGRVDTYRGVRQLTHPEALPLDRVARDLGGRGATEGIDDDELEDLVAEIADSRIPIYPLASGLKQWQLLRAVRAVLRRAGELPDPLPKTLRMRRGLPSTTEAMQLVHLPRLDDDIERGLRRLRYDEALALQLVLARRRHSARAETAAPRPVRAGGLLEAFDARLPFDLTGGQRAVSEEILDDLARQRPMQRLLQGEVGSGKTVVALRAMLATVDAGGQAALLAPTEVLAQQHHRSITALLGPLAEHGLLGGAEVATRVALLTGSLGAARRRAALLEAAAGQAGIVVGTHALLEDPVDFADLGLVVVDEQHRFGVEQRDALRAKGRTSPHLLVMTATPIPRTVAMTVFGDLDVSTLRELPAGRGTLTTHVVPVGERPHYLDRAWARIREEVAAGHRAYVVCPRIAGDDREAGDDDADEPADDARRPAVGVEEVAPMLASGPLAGLRVAVLHGRLPAEDKDDVMRRFADGEVDVLVATTVVEVGVDVPEATVMVVMDADRFGISQLHQLRGRVGRGGDDGLCLLVTDRPPGSPARERLDAVAAGNDGFELANLDLQHRREGDVLGSVQSGRRSGLRLLSVLRDADLIADARDDARALVDADPDLDRHPDLREVVRRHWADERSAFLQKA